ncbi:caspase family protein [Bradyrhizobium australiense]|uniref:Caspase family protein n=1 Tax=Bradyrhizobium australiense TaxID=2721161 RepID=A0A7Y4GSL7_9BRAD|nr:caspase family protein [Bradyrhizobium australiense]NOJ41244.1 caspase family protein [Bradyrhizobium australiense]
MSRFKLSLLGASLLASLLSFAVTGAALAEAPNVDIRNGMQAPPADQRVALVIGNSNYQIAPKLANPGNDAQSMAQLLNSAGFEVTQATDLTRSDMVKVVRDFSARVAERGPGTVAMIYYAGHGVQVAGENYLLPVDAKIASPSDLDGNSVRLVDMMGTLESIPSRMRIVVLDACRNNPFPEINDAGRGLAIVDAPNGSIVGYSTAPGMEAQDGDGNHSPYTSAFLNVAREPNLPIEQLFKRVRLEVNNTTSGRQTPWESSSLTSDFYFFGDTAVAAGRAPDRRPIMQTTANLPSRSVRQAYDYVLSEGSPEYYEEFIRLYPHDPLCDHIRLLLGNLRVATAWHKAVIANSPFAYKTFHDNYSNSPYAKSALKLQVAPKAVPLMQFTHLAKQSPTFKPGNIGNSPIPGISKGNLNGNLGAHGHRPVPSKIVTFPAKGMSQINAANGGNNNGNTGKVTTLPGKINSLPVNAGNSGNPGKVTRLPGRINSHPIRIVNRPVNTSRPVFNTAPRRFGGGMGGGNFSQRFAASPARSSFGRMGGFRR